MAAVIIEKFIKYCDIITMIVNEDKETKDV
jgi:hypothetical protein